MAKVCVITSTGLADGFRLAGVEVHAAESSELARAALLALTRREDVGLVAVDSGLYGALDARTRATLEARPRPLVIPIPAATMLAPAERRSRRVAELIRRAVGVSVTIRGAGRES